MALDRAQFQQIYEAIAAGYDEAGLRRMVRFEMGESLDRIAKPGALDERVFELVEWVDRTGRERELVQAAHRGNPTNPALKALVEAWFPPAVLADTAPPAAIGATFPQIFLSYSREDSEVMQGLLTALVGAGLPVWTDEGLEPGSPRWQSEIEKAIQRTGCMVVLLSPDAKQSEWVTIEVSYAQELGRRVFLLLVRGNKADAVPVSLFNTQYVDARQDYAGAVSGKLLPALRRHLNPAGAVPSAHAPESTTDQTVPINGHSERSRSADGPPPVPNPLRSFARRRYDLSSFCLPRNELDNAMSHIVQAIEGRPDGEKPFLVLRGAPGIGKTWLLERVREQCQSRGVRCSEVVQAQDLIATPEARLKKLLFWCDPTAPASSAAPAETVQELSNRLDHILISQSQPIALFYDDLDYWVNQLSDDSLQQVYQQLWWPILRSRHLPGLVICTSRELMPDRKFSVGMKRKLQLIHLEALKDGPINKLATGILEEPPYKARNPTAVAADKLNELAQRYACGNPLVVDWIAWKLAQDSQGFDAAGCDATLRELAHEIIGGRLDESEEELLISLARDFPDGVADSHPILGAAGPQLMRRLRQVGLVDLIPGTATYQVLPPLACLWGQRRFSR